MKQEWFESNDFVKTTSKNKPEEQAQEVADKAEERISDLDTPIEKNTQLESPYIPDQAPKARDKWKEQVLDF